MAVAGIRNEGGVKKRIKKLLFDHAWWSWMPATHGYGTSGVSDFNALHKGGVFLAIEAKFGSNKPTPQQLNYLHLVKDLDGFAFVVNEKNLDSLEAWLEAFGRAVKAQLAGEPVTHEDGAMMANAMIELLAMLYPDAKPAND